MSRWLFCFPLMLLGLTFPTFIHALAADEPERVTIHPEIEMSTYVGQEILTSGLVLRVETDDYGHQKAFLETADGFYLFVRKPTRDRIGLFDLNQFANGIVYVRGKVGTFEGAPYLLIEEGSQISTTPLDEVASSESAEPDPEAPPATPGDPFPLQQVMLHSLLVETNSAGRAVGLCNRLTATVTAPTSFRRPSQILDFNQPVGKSMSRSLSEVSRFLELRHTDWKATYRGDITYGFEDKWTDKSGPSAALPLALLAESIYTGIPIPDDLAVTGDLNSDGSVQPIGGVGAKLKAARAAGMRIVLIPAENVPDLFDLVVEGDWDFVRGLHVIGIETFDQAWEVITATEESNLVQSLKRYETALASGRANAPEMAAIAQLYPRHASAYLIYLAASRQLPSSYSLRGSLERVGGIFGPFMAMIGDSKETGLPKAVRIDNLYSNTASALRDLRSKSDPRTHEYIDALIDYVEVVKVIPTLPTGRYGRPSASARTNRVIDELSEAGTRIEEAERQIQKLEDLTRP